jgi:hypothetical protein
MCCLAIALCELRRRAAPQSVRADVILLHGLTIGSSPWEQVALSHRDEQGNSNKRHNLEHEF